MSGDLISKDVLLEDIRNNITECSGIMGWLKLINSQPVAYDVDKVVEKLEDAKSMVPVNRLLDDIINDKPKELGQLMAYDKAIKIVKAGGVV